MDKKYAIETTDGVIAVRFIQKPDAIDICKSLDDAAEISPGLLRLWDFTCGADLSNDEIEIVAHHAKSIHLPSGKVAIVAPQNLTYGVFRVYAANRDEKGVKLKVFRAEQEARDWLKEESVE